MEKKVSLNEGKMEKEKSNDCLKLLFNDNDDLFEDICEKKKN